MAQKEGIMAITVQKNVSREELDRLGVFQWPVWTKGVSKFPWTYDEQEVCYLLEGDVVVTPEGGTPVQFGRGDLVTLPEGMACTWEVRSPVKKHYSFG